ncbi:NAD-dependent epimerase/dehydratase family protein [cf. Phormidesmis sp. LEGE 11477]|uniref:NAD-dependent epimerase/dehydratase family protein n=1 Tax=cf. Phormidesmis sp. LEGE 11477 TaxID=1828680 RepID=UPI00188092FB|nr:NAD-dependent epimerase/dehydratase family protein [cf. Phormidesmis sp. LEGE 11477]MBE9063292.1 NAD-dependent epimerase/dehydratase family protein [cf. Phormidesmis sp. LEGE 11477]
MKIFLTGASGYIGGSIATALVTAGHTVDGLCRSAEKSRLLKQAGINPVIGSLSDEKTLEQSAQAADAVINAADADDPFAVEVLLRAIEGSGKKLIHTSGSSIVGDRAAGEYSSRVFHEDITRPICFEKIGRVAVDTRVIEGVARGVHSIVICPCLIYGQGTGLHTQSIQIPLMIAAAKKYQQARYVGKGENIWSTVYIKDLVGAYLLALEKAPAGSFFFLESGEATFKEIAETIHHRLALSGTAQTWTIEEAVQEWGQEAAHFAFGSNSHIRSDKARSLLGWTPKHASALDWLKTASNL